MHDHPIFGNEDKKNLEFPEDGTFVQRIDYATYS